MSSIEKSPEKTETPVMRQYWDLKTSAGVNTLLFFRMGDFYELFGDDAITASKLLGITLTSRDRKAENPTPMAGVPFHSAQGYIQKALDAGYKVAIAEQMSDPAKGLVERKIVRVFTPAVQFEDSAAEGHLAIVHAVGKNEYLLVQMLPSTGDIWISEILNQQVLLNDISWPRVKHVLTASGRVALEIVQALDAMDGMLVEEIAFNSVPESQAKKYLEEQFGLLSLGHLLETPPAQHALALLVRYVTQTQSLERLTHLKLPRELHEKQSLRFGQNTYDHLDAEELFNFINSCATSMGKRELRRIFMHPLTEVGAIQSRQQAIEELSKTSTFENHFQKTFSQVYDLDRILARVSTKLANPRDTLALAGSLKLIEEFPLHTFQSTLLQECAKKLVKAFENIHGCHSKILKAQFEEAPFHAREGRVFKRGYSAELDHWIDLTENGEKFLIDLERRERESTGISSLKVKYNRVFGYFIEISSANLKSTPSHYQRKQTMVGGERFFTEELKKFEEEMLHASTKRNALEQDLFEKLVNELAALSSELQKISECIGELDAFVSLSRLIAKPGWSFPEINASHEVHLVHSRHPVLDAPGFVPNTLIMQGTLDRIWLITGPNMGGKSTVMRQIALTYWLAQIGAPVSATIAKLGIIDALFTRIGAHDALAKGQSTFMVEMTELAHILHNLTPRSLVILDEVGRGTSTYDGVSVAWATLEHLAAFEGARVLFATHYHELTSLEAQFSTIKNFHLEVEESRNKLRFTYELHSGPCAKSFGIQVAKLAGLPTTLIDRAKGVLKNLETNTTTPQLDLFSVHPAPEEPGLTTDLAQELADLDPLSMTPMDALRWIADQKAKL